MNRPVDALIQNHLDGKTDAAGAARLSGLLVADASVRRRYLEMADLHARLATGEFPVKHAPAGNSADRMLAQWLRSGWMPRVAAVFVAGAAGFAWWLARGPGYMAEPGGFAVLKEERAARWNGDIPSVGDVMSGGRHVLGQGIVEIEFTSGARMVAQAPAEMTFASPNQVMLHLGRARFFVPPGARGFTVVSPSVTVVDLGTSFGVRAGLEDGDLVKVMQGEVSVRGGGNEEPLLAGEGVLVEPAGKWRMREVEEEEFPQMLRPLPGSGNQSGFAGNPEIRKMPGLVLYFPCEPRQPDDVGLINASGWSRRGSYGTLRSAGWENGRDGAGAALAFRSPDARVRLLLDMPLAAFSLATWVRLDESPAPGRRGLFMSDGEKPGAVHWSIGADGLARLESVGMDGRNRFVSVSREKVPSVGTRRWVHLAVTVEGGVVNHYLDGRPTGTDVWVGQDAVLPNRITLGNWQGANPSSPVVGCLHGAMDDFVLFQRALKPAEVTRLHGDGSP